MGPLGAGRVGWTLTPIVSASSSAEPHDGQKRAVSGTSLLQPGQVTGRILLAEGV
jgi:hypothetical protein